VQDGIITTIAGTGFETYNGDGIPATDANIKRPYGIVIDPCGMVYFATEGRIRLIDGNRRVLNVAGTGNFIGQTTDVGPPLAVVLRPMGLAIDLRGNILAADSNFDLPQHGRLRLISDGVLRTIAGGGSLPLTDGAKATEVRIAPVNDVAVDSQSGDIYIAELGIRRLRSTVQSKSPLVNAMCGVVDAASFRSAVSPGSWVSVLGRRLSETERMWRADDIVNGVLPTSLDGISVSINGKPAAIAYVGPTQLNVQAPDDETIGPVFVEVTTPTGKASSKTTLCAIAPALFTSYSTRERRHVAAVHGDGVYVGNPDDLPGATPAQPGEVITLYGTGFGPTTPQQRAGVIVVPAKIANSMSVIIGGIQAEVEYAGLVSVGLYQFNIRVPERTQPGDHLISIRIADVQTQGDAFIAVK
jgi:uncharacterized protein (TIGR03437 family)